MVSIGLIGYIVILLTLLQAMESFALNFQVVDKEQVNNMAAKNRAIAHGNHGPKGRKSSENHYKKAHFRTEIRKLRGMMKSQPSKSSTMNEFEALCADYGHPNPHPPGHN